MGTTTVVIAPEDAVALEMIKLGYATESPEPNDAARNLKFRAKFDTLAGAQAAVRVIDEYNNFDGETVAEALELCGLGGFGGWAEIGREYSPVIYIRPHDVDDIAEAMAAMRDARADAVELDSRGYVRAWWD